MKPSFVVIGDLLVSNDLMAEQFACDLSKCKGACCVAGELGAPLEKSELKILEQIYPFVVPYMRTEGILAVEQQGKYVYDRTQQYSTPLLGEDEPCVYVNYDEKGVALCAIEQAYLDGKISFQKPVSCHLYPIRIKKSKQMEALNYDRWEICQAACVRGTKEKIRVYEFVRDALIRKYGKEFYAELDAIAKDLHP